MAKNKGQFNGGKGMNALDRIQAREKAIYDRNMGAQADFLLQIGCDAFIMACADLYDIQPGRVPEAVETYRKYIYDCMAYLVEDAKDDTEITFFWADLDRRMEQICGTAFVPKEERYDDSGRRVFNNLLRRYAEILKAEKAAGEAGADD